MPAMTINTSRLLVLSFACMGSVAAAITMAGCAGPTTPLGAVRAVHPSQVNTPKLSRITSLFKILTPGANNPSVSLYPQRQVLHGAHSLTVVIHEPRGLGHKTQSDVLNNIIIRHNGLDVSASFLAQAKARMEQDKIYIHVPKVRLSPKREHQIEVVYGATGNNAYARLEPPRCEPKGDRAVFSTDGFKPSSQLLRQIHELSRNKGFSPVFLAALIAQESGFNSQRVSWAKAMGLTQVTGAAEDEIFRLDQSMASYPRYPGINAMPYMWVEALITAGTVNAANEWRLDPGRSIMGGLRYLEFLHDVWSTPENEARINNVFGPEEYVDAKGKLILASYNSGYSRVLSALARYEYSWMFAPELGEARKYVGRIYSYCEHFGEPEMAQRFDDIINLKGDQS